MSNYTKTTNFATKDNLSPGNPLKIVKGTEIDTEFNNIATAVATKTDNSAAAITGGTITGITDLAVADGGTGASTAAGGLNNLLPTQTGNANKYLQTDGTNATWDAVSLSTSDITGTLPVANGGTGVTTSTGTGAVVLSNSPTLVTPALGIPASGTATNLTGLPISTGVSGLGTGVATFLATPSSANLISAVTDETGTGSLVFATSPTLVTPALGTPSALVGTNITGTASGLTAGNVTTNANLTGAVTSVGNATSLGSFSSSNLAGALTDETGSGSAVFATSPTLVTPILGTPTSATLTNATGLPISTGVSGLGTGVATALAVNVGSSGAPLVNGGVLGTPSSGTVTNLTGTASININGTVGATTANTGAFTSLTATSGVISANSSSDALRITQIGSGNALLVEDSANPDSTPFVITASGYVGIGTTSPGNYTGGLVVFGQVIETIADDANGGIQGSRSSADVGSSNWYFNKSRGTTASKVIVNSGDSLGILNWRGYDGASNIVGATISAAVDGTPGTNDMPGRLLFSTTADGASTPTERMRIDSAGQVGIGATPSAGNTLLISKNITGATSAFSTQNTSTIQSDVTSAAYIYSSQTSTQAASFTLPNLIHFTASQGTIGASSTVTNQFGFFVNSPMTGATNNYGFYGNLASGTGRFNLYMAGTANNYLAGSLGIGALPTAALPFYVVNTPNASTAFGAAISPTFGSTTTSIGYGLQVASGTQAASFTCGNLISFNVTQGTIGATSTVTNQFGYRVDSTLTGATNNYGFYGNIASGTGRYNLYMNGTAENFFGGNTVISVTDNTNAALRITQLGTGNAILVEDSTNPDSSPFVVNAAGQVSAGFTSNPATMFGTVPQLGVHTTGNDGLANYRAGNDVNGASFVFQKTRGSDPSVNTIVQAGDTLGGIYWTGADGTSYLRAAQILGQVDSPSPGTSDMPGRIVFSTTADGASTPTERMRISNTGNVGIGATANASAILDVQSTTKGLRMPNMTTTEKNAISSPAAGLMVFDTTLAKLCVYSGSAWQTITSV